MSSLPYQAGEDSLEFPARFARQFGRAPRILHLGNVANYAYTNAKIMRSVGIDCDVLDPDFYHIMATPEWLETPVDGDHGDDFLPQWGQVDLHGYERPRWFVQGPAQLAFHYLANLRAGYLNQADWQWARMAFERRLLAKDMPPTELAFWTDMALPIRIPRALLRRGQRLLDQLTAPELAPAAPISVPADVAPYANNAALYRTALQHFDIVQGYTTSGIYPAVCGIPRYTAYELGTLRGLPFEDSPTGRLTAWLYRNAPEVFVTNVDCLTHAARLGIEPARTSPVLHAYDVDGAVAYARAAKVTPDTEPPMIFAPARHHWQDGNASWLKGNDVLIKAAGQVARSGVAFKLVFVRWGAELDKSDALIVAEGLAAHVEWIRPQSRLKLWPYYLRAAAVADQFKAAAFGGVALDAMALGKRLLIRYDAEAAAAFFRSAPPIYNCADVDTLAAALREVLADPLDRGGRGRAHQIWMESEHGVERQLRTQFSAYERLLTRTGIDPKIAASP
jgi:glycosyltransferase involved in cell wall biosynthesis